MASRLVRGWRRCPPPLLSCPARRRSQRPEAEPEPEGEPEPDAPIPFRSSRANPRAWSVAQSIGHGQQQPTWKALPLGLGLGISALLLWAALREDEAAAPGPGETPDGSEGAQPSAEAAAAGPGPSALQPG